jgi:hypothetical protein
MTEQPPKPPPEQPRYEPEIIPPGATRDPFGSQSPFGSQGTQRIYVGRIGPLGIIMIALAVGFVVALVLVLLLGAFLLWIPIVAVLFTVGLVSALWRKYIWRAP